MKPSHPTINGSMYCTKHLYHHMNIILWLLMMSNSKDIEDVDHHILYSIMIYSDSILITIFNLVCQNNDHRLVRFILKHGYYTRSSCDSNSPLSVVSGRQVKSYEMYI